MTVILGCDAVGTIDSIVVVINFGTTDIVDNAVVAGISPLSASDDSAAVEVKLTIGFIAIEVI